MQDNPKVFVGQRELGSRRKRSRVWLWLVLGFSGILAALIAAAVILFPHFLMRKIEEEARAQGVVLTGCSLDYTLSRITLTGCAFELVELPEVSGRIGKIEVEIEDWKPKSAKVSDPAIVIRELPNVSLSDRLPQWLEQRAQLGKDAKLPLLVENGQLDLLGGSDAGADSVPLVTLTKFTFDSRTESAKGDIVVGGMITGTFSHKDTRSELDVSLKLSPSTKFRISVDTGTASAELRVDFEQLPLAAFAIPPFITLPEELLPVQADGQVYAEVPYGLSTKGVRGDIRATLVGLPMPVPREIQGLVYGPAALFESKFKLHPNNQKMDLKPLTLTSGVLKLKGSAEVEVRDLALPFQAQLTGSLSCGAILEAATKAHTDSPLALEAAKLGRKALTGGVGIAIAVDGDLFRLQQTKMLRTIGVGCGLKPLPLPDELKDLSEKILKGMPKPPKLPDAPEVDLELPDPPKFELPKFPGFGRPRKELNEGDTDPAPQE